MRTPLLILLPFLATACTSPRSVVELPRPNSGTFTFDEAEARKHEIYDLSPSGDVLEWKNPYVGFGIHVGRADEIVVHDSLFGNGTMTREQLAEIVEKHSALLHGNPLGVLVTCARDPNQSETLPFVVDLLFEPSIQIFYTIRDR